MRRRAERRPRRLQRALGGEGLDDIGRYRLLLQMMHGQADRRAHFHTTITCAFPNGDVLQDDGEVEGTIAFAPMGENGFGYDPVFSCLTSERPLHSFRQKKRRRFRTAARHCGHSRKRSGIILRNINKKDKEILWN